jgi:hypothetical protein
MKSHKLGPDVVDATSGFHDFGRRKKSLCLTILAQVFFFPG